MFLGSGDCCGIVWHRDARLSPDLPSAAAAAAAGLPVDERKEGNHQEEQHCFRSTEASDRLRDWNR